MAEPENNGTVSAHKAAPTEESLSKNDRTPRKAQAPLKRSRPSTPSNSNLQERLNLSEDELAKLKPEHQYRIVPCIPSINTASPIAPRAPIDTPGSKRQRTENDYLPSIPVTERAAYREAPSRPVREAHLGDSPRVTSIETLMGSGSSTTQSTYASFLKHEKATKRPGDSINDGGRSLALDGFPAQAFLNTPLTGATLHELLIESVTQNVLARLGAMDSSPSRHQHIKEGPQPHSSVSRDHQQSYDNLVYRSDPQPVYAAPSAYSSELAQASANPITTAPLRTREPVAMYLSRQQPSDYQNIIMQNPKYARNPALDAPMVEARAAERQHLERQPTTQEHLNRQPTAQEHLNRQSVTRDVFERQPVRQEAVERQPIRQEVFDNQPARQNALGIRNLGQEPSGRAEQSSERPPVKQEALDGRALGRYPPPKEQASYREEAPAPARQPLNSDDLMYRLAPRPSSSSPRHPLLDAPLEETRKQATTTANDLIQRFTPNAAISSPTIDNTRIEARLESRLTPASNDQTHSASAQEKSSSRKPKYSGYVHCKYTKGGIVVWAVHWGRQDPKNRSGYKEDVQSKASAETTAMLEVMNLICNGRVINERDFICELIFERNVAPTFGHKVRQILSASHNKSVSRSDCSEAGLDYSQAVKYAGLLGNCKGRGISILVRTIKDSDEHPQYHSAASSSCLNLLKNMDH